VASRWQPEPPKPDQISDICDNSRQCSLSLIEREKPTQTLGFSDTDPISDICDTGDLTISNDSDNETTVRKLSDIFEAGAVSLISKENDVANVANSKTPSFTKENSRHSPLSLNVANVANASPTEPQKPDKSLTIDPDSGLEVKVVCPTCGSWRRVPPDALMLAEPRCSTCGSVMKPEPEDSGARYIDTEDWVASFFEASNEPVVFDLETNEAIPVASPNLPAKEARCPRCGHCETVDPEVLLPPLCPACGSPMEWVNAPDPPDSSPNDPLIEAVSRIANLSSQLKTGGGQQ